MLAHPSSSVFAGLSNYAPGACPRTLSFACLCHQQVNSWLMKPGRPVLQVYAYLSAHVLDIHSIELPGETAEKTLKSEELKLGRSWLRKSGRRDLVIRITSTQGNHQRYQEWPQTNWEPAAGELQEKTTAGQEKWCHSGK